MPRNLDATTVAEIMQARNQNAAERLRSHGWGFSSVASVAAAIQAVRTSRNASGRLMADPAEYTVRFVCSRFTGDYKVVIFLASPIPPRQWWRSGKLIVAACAHNAVVTGPYEVFDMSDVEIVFDSGANCFRNAAYLAAANFMYVLMQTRMPDVADLLLSVRVLEDFAL